MFAESQSTQWFYCLFLRLGQHRYAHSEESRPKLKAEPLPIKKKKKKLIFFQKCSQLFHLQSKRNLPTWCARPPSYCLLLFSWRREALQTSLQNSLLSGHLYCRSSGPSPAGVQSLFQSLRRQQTFVLWTQDARHFWRLPLSLPIVFWNNQSK